jgi:hypothetical protein
MSIRLFTFSHKIRASRIFPQVLPAKKGRFNLTSHISRKIYLIYMGGG